MYTLIGPYGPHVQNGISEVTCMLSSNSWGAVLDRFATAFYVPRKDYVIQLPGYWSVCILGICIDISTLIECHGRETCDGILSSTSQLSTLPQLINGHIEAAIYKDQVPFPAI